ncbi:Fasciclin-like arabinogalactan protein 17-like protein [Drosera capensis]
MLPLLLFLLFAVTTSAATQPSRNSTTGVGGVNSNSILVALLDSHYTELAELVEKALLLPTLEHVVGDNNITIFAPRNDAVERGLDPDFKRFLLEPGNLASLQSLLLFHVVPRRIHSSHWPRRNYKTQSSPIELSSSSSVHRTLCRDEQIRLDRDASHHKVVHSVKVVKENDIVRVDGVIHGIERMLVPESVISEFNRRRSLRSIAAVLPTGAPEVDPRTHRLKHPAAASASVPAGAPPVLPVSDALAPGPSIAPAPAPGPGGAHHHFDGEAQVKDFIQTLLHYGGYNELADILVNLTSLATEMGRLVSEGYVVTVLAPNDEAMAKLTAEQLSEPGAPEQIMYYHMVPEYQTEESMYNAVRRFGKVRYETLRLPHKVTAEEADGSVKFGEGDGSAYLFDPDIFTDGRISVQGIDGVLFPAEENAKEAVTTKPTVARPTAKVVAKPRRGKLLEVACHMLGAIGQDSRFTSCLL